jgi:acyl-CoA reductase-like NAD-dependent aldehyde dehydrogenase
MRNNIFNCFRTTLYAPIIVINPRYLLSIRNSVLHQKSNNYCSLIAAASPIQGTTRKHHHHHHQSRSSNCLNFQNSRHHFTIYQIRTMVQGVTIENNMIINRNPATGEIISHVKCSTEDEVNTMMDNGQIAYNTVWGNHLSNQERINYIRIAMEELSTKEKEIIPLITQEMGKPMKEAEAEFAAACNKKNDAYLNLLEQSVQPKQHGTNSIVVRQSMGIVVILSPWNFPCDEILLLTLPALGCGNTVIVKPSEVSPEVGAMTINTLASKLPKNVLQLAQGDGTVGAMLVSHPNTRMIAMTGSSNTGKHIMKQTSNDLKRLVLELGGKDPMIVFDDCEMNKAAHDAVEYSLCNTGQVCCSIERIYVADMIYDTFCTMVTDIASTYKVGNGMDPNVAVGPLVSSIQYNKVQEQVDDAIQKGAKLLYQSDIPKDLEGGTFYPVTVLANVRDGMKIYHEETFGPVVCISKFDNSEREAIRLANDTEYGLGSCVYTTDIDKATRIANQIDAGQVGINCYAIDNMNIACPWVGHKQSGYGYHSGIEGFHNFSIPKTIVYANNIPNGTLK